LKKLIICLSSLHEDEYPKLIKFIKFHITESSTYVEIIEDFYRHRINKIESIQSIGEMREKMRPDLSRKSFQNLISELCKVIEEYFRLKEVQVDEFENDLLLLKAYRRRGLFKLFDKQSKKIREKLQNDYDIWSSLNLLRVDHLTYFSDNPIKKERGDDLMLSLCDGLVISSQELLLYYQAEIRNRGLQFKLESKEIDFDNFEPLSYLGSCFNHLLQMQEGKKSSFDFIENELLSNVRLSKEIRLVFLLQLLRNKSKFFDDYRNEKEFILRLYKFALDEQIFWLNEKLPINRLHNIIDVACSHQAFDWVEENIESWTTQLEAGVRKNTLALVKAQLIYANNDIENRSEKVIKLLSKKSFSDIKQETRARSLMLCCYHDEEYYKTNKEFYLSQVRTFRRYVQRHKTTFSSLELESLIYFSKCLKLLSGNIKIKYLRIKEICESHPVFYKTWVKNKIPN